MERQVILRAPAHSARVSASAWCPMAFFTVGARRIGIAIWHARVVTRTTFACLLETTGIHAHIGASLASDAHHAHAGHALPGADARFDQLQFPVVGPPL